MQLSAGISDADIEAAERGYEAHRLPSGTDYWQHQILQTRPTEDLDAYIESGLENLLRRVDPKWLRDQALNPYRLDSSFLNNPIHVVNGVRVGANLEVGGPQRFARMLLLCQDHLRKESNLEFFSAATLAPEVAMLGNSLDEIAALGTEAALKLASLRSMPDEMVTSKTEGGAPKALGGFGLLLGEGFADRFHAFAGVGATLAAVRGGVN